MMVTAQTKGTQILGSPKTSENANTSGCPYGWIPYHFPWEIIKFEERKNSGQGGTDDVK